MRDRVTGDRLEGSGVVTALPQNKHLIGCACLMMFIFAAHIHSHPRADMNTVHVSGCIFQLSQCLSAAQLRLLRSQSQSRPV